MIGKNAPQSHDQLRIGGACGYWGESTMATAQFLNADCVDFIIYDYLAEITMSLMAKARAKDPNAGYAPDFLSAVLQPNLRMIADKGVRLVSNAGGVNPSACAKAARDLISALGLDLKVAVITGDDLLDKKAEIAQRDVTDIFSEAAFPPPETIASINAYIGAFAIAKALNDGADIVITGRCVDSALTLGPCIHAFGWKVDDYDLLANGSLAGHIIECGPQATGGNFTDWEQTGDIADIGYPVATVRPDGRFDITKPENTNGLVSVGTVSEQLLYEIGDPQHYILPDVVCDFSSVEITQTAPDRVSVRGATGRPGPNHYKTCLTHTDGFRTGMMITHYGYDARQKAKAFAKATLDRASKKLRDANLGPFTEISVEHLGTDSQFGSANASREVVTKIAVKHPSPMGCAMMLKELAGLGLASPPGLSGFQGARPKPVPVYRLFSYLTNKQDVTLSIDMDGSISQFNDSIFDQPQLPQPNPSQTPKKPTSDEPMVEVPLIKLAFGRSGDKGNSANIGIIARDPELLPWLWHGLSFEKVAGAFAHFIAGGCDTSKVEKFFLPGPHAINFLITDTLGDGGVASLRNDPQGKGFAQILLSQTIAIPQTIAEHYA